MPDMTDLLSKAYIVYDWAANLLPPLIVLLSVMAGRTKSTKDDLVVKALKTVLGLVMRFQLPNPKAREIAAGVAKPSPATTPEE